MAESKLAGPIKLCKQCMASYNVFSVVLVFSMLSLGWLHSDIRSCCRQSAHVFTSRYDSALLGCAFFIPKVFLDEISSLL